MKHKMDPLMSRLKTTNQIVTMYWMWLHVLLGCKRKSRMLAIKRLSKITIENDKASFDSYSISTTQLSKR